MRSRLSQILALTAAWAGSPLAAKGQEVVTHLEALARVSHRGSADGGYSLIDVQDLTIEELRYVYFWPGDGDSLGHIIAGLNVQSQRGVPLMDAGPRSMGSTNCF